MGHYENLAAKFLAFMGERANADIAEVTTHDILAYWDNGGAQTGYQFRVILNYEFDLL